MNIKQLPAIVKSKNIDLKAIYLRTAAYAHQRFSKRKGKKKLKILVSQKKGLRIINGKMDVLAKKKKEK